VSAAYFARPTPQPINAPAPAPHHDPTIAAPPAPIHDDVAASKPHGPSRQRRAPDLELRQLRAFVLLVDSGNLSAAARALGVAQSTMSELVYFKRSHAVFR
jgi:hypothetical protein